MSPRAANWLAWAACLITGVLLSGAVSLALLSDRFGADPGLLAVDVVLCALVGALVSWRKPANAVGWILLGSAMCLALQEVAREYAAYGLIVEPGSLPMAQPMAWLLSWIYVPGILLLLAFLPLYFPDGRLPSPRWKWLALSAVLLTITMVAFSAFSPGPIKDTHIVNPLGVEALRSAFELIDHIIAVALFLNIFAAVASLLVRFRRSVGDERQQIKWLLYAAAAIPAWFVSNPLLGAAFPVLAERATFLWLTDNLLLAGVPVAIGVAILKYRLYDIDVIINRTLVYGLLTATLALVYLGGVTASQALFRVLTDQEGQSQLAIVVSTLIIAALLNPLRRNIQAFVDRRFYRRKYDAAKTLEAFNARLREETDLDALSADLVGVASRTVQPEHAFLWLRPDTSSKGEQPVQQILIHPRNAY